MSIQPLEYVIKCDMLHLLMLQDQCTQYAWGNSQDVSKGKLSPSCLFCHGPKSQPPNIRL